jgi:hypothetical protein
MLDQHTREVQSMLRENLGKALPLRSDREFAGLLARLEKRITRD